MALAVKVAYNHASSKPLTYLETQSMRGGIDQGTCWNYWWLSYRRKAIRDLWMMALVVGTLIGLTLALHSDNYVGLIVVCSFIGLVSAATNYRRWQTEVRIKQLVARGEARCWRQVAVVQDGHDLPIGYTTYLFVTDDDYKVTVNGWTFQTGRSQRLNDRESDVLPADGPQAGQSIPQITQIEGDVLMACAGPPGGARPTEFTSQPGSGQTLSVWLRVT